MILGQVDGAIRRRQEGRNRPTPYKLKRSSYPTSAKWDYSHSWEAIHHQTKHTSTKKAQPWSTCPILPSTTLIARLGIIRRQPALYHLRGRNSAQSALHRRTMAHMRCKSTLHPVAE